MAFYPHAIEAPSNFTRVKMVRTVAGVTSTLLVDLVDYWTYEDCRYVVFIHYKGWSYVRAELFAYTPREKQWVKVPGVVLPKGVG